MKIKISSSELRESVERRRAKVVAHHERAKGRYDAAVEKTRPKLAQELREYAEAIEGGEEPLPRIGSNYSGRRERRIDTVEVPCRTKVPSDIGDADTTRLDQLLRTLKVTKEQDIVLEPREASEYLDDSGDLDLD